MMIYHPLFMLDLWVPIGAIFRMPNTYGHQATSPKHHQALGSDLVLAIVQALFAPAREVGDGRQPESVWVQGTAEMSQGTTGSPVSNDHPMVYLAILVLGFLEIKPFLQLENWCPVIEPCNHVFLGHLQIVLLKTSSKSLSLRNSTV